MIPFGSVIGNRARLAGLNLIGLRRRGVDKARLHTIRAAFRTLFGGDGVFAQRLETVRAQYADEPLVMEMLAFAETPSKRGLIRTSLAAEDDSGTFSLSPQAGEGRGEGGARTERCRT